MSNASEDFNKQRLETFVDAILAIILTILVLEFKVPHIENATSNDLKNVLVHMLPSFFSYIFSFLIVITLWLDHHEMCLKITRVDKTFAILNFIFLLCLSPLPFTTAFAGEYLNVPFAVALVAANYLLMNLGFVVIYTYSLQKKLLPENYIHLPKTKRAAIFSFSGLILLTASIPLAYVNTYIPFVLFVIVMLMHLLKK